MNSFHFLDLLFLENEKQVEKDRCKASDSPFENLNAKIRRKAFASSFDWIEAHTRLQQQVWCWCVQIPCSYAGLIDVSKTNAPSKVDKGKAVAQEPTTSKPKSKQN